MKKYTTLLLIILVYLFGQFSYDLARPLDDQQIKEIEAARKSTSSQPVADLGSIKAINRQVAGEVLPGSKLYGLKIFGEKLRSYFSKTEKETQKLKVIFLNRRLAEAEILLEDGKAGQAQQLVNQFAKGSEGLMAELKKQDYLRTDPELATDIEKSIASQIDLQKNLMIMIGSTSPLFPIKSRLLQLELQMADTPEERRSVLSEQATERQEKAISADNTKKIEQLTDWQIAKKEFAAIGRRARDYAEANGRKVSRVYGAVIEKAREIMSKVRK
jgi:hypothetical protein